MGRSSSLHLNLAIRKMKSNESVAHQCGACVRSSNKCALRRFLGAIPAVNAEVLEYNRESIGVLAAGFADWHAR
jgi:hypothetical protein